MKAVAQYPDAHEAYKAIDKLSEASIYAAITGYQRKGYEVLVRDSQFDLAKRTLGTANETSTARQSTPEVTK